MLAIGKTFKAGVKVKTDHGGGLGTTIGRAKNLRIDGDKLRGDVHLFKSAHDRELLLEMAEEVPEEFGASASFDGPVEVIDGNSFQRCAELFSFDLVDIPAANSAGLFSKKEETFDTPERDMEPDENYKALQASIEEMRAAFAAKHEELESRLLAMAPAEKAELSDEEKEQLAAKETKMEEDRKDEMSDVFTRALSEVLPAQMKTFAASLGVNVTNAPKNDTTKANPEPIKFGALVASKVSEGMGKSEAINFCVKHNPAEYKAARDNNELGNI